MDEELRNEVTEAEETEVEEIQQESEEETDVSVPGEYPWMTNQSTETSYSEGSNFGTVLLGLGTAFGVGYATCKLAVPKAKKVVGNIKKWIDDKKEDKEAEKRLREERIQERMEQKRQAERDAEIKAEVEAEVTAEENSELKEEPKKKK